MCENPLSEAHGSGEEDFFKLLLDMMGFKYLLHFFPRRRGTQAKETALSRKSEMTHSIVSGHAVYISM